MTIAEAIHEALYAGAQPQMLPRPRRLLCPPPAAWRGHADIDRDEVLAVLDAHPAEVASILASFQGVTEELTAYTRAKARGDADAMAWWRERLHEDYGYVVGQASIIDESTLPWWQARMGDSVGPDVSPTDAT